MQIASYLAMTYNFQIFKLPIYLKPQVITPTRQKEIFKSSNLQISKLLIYLVA